MTSQTGQLVLNSFLYHYGRGFYGVEEWWGYILQQDEQRRLDTLFGLALLDNRIYQLLITECDELCHLFHLSKDLRKKLSNWEGGTLSELAQYLQE